MIKDSLISSARQIPCLPSSNGNALQGKCEYLAHNLLSRLGEDSIVELVGSENSVRLENCAVRHFRYIQSFLDLYDPQSFVEIFQWIFRTYSNHGFHSDYWQKMLPESRLLLRQELSTEDYYRTVPFYEWLLDNYTGMMEISRSDHSYFEIIASDIDDNHEDPSAFKLDALSSRYVDLLLQSKRAEAIDLIQKESRSGLSLEKIYLGVLQPAMYKIGRKWQNNEISVAVEHYCTAATQMLMAMLFPLCLDSEKNSLKMLGCCLGSELHELGMRMVSDFFEFAGWNTYFLGAVTPSECLIDTIEAEKPDIICLSASMYFGVPQTRELISRIKEIKSYPAPQVMVGGLAFNLNPGLAETVGADGYSDNASSAVDTASNLIGTC